MLKFFRKYNKWMLVTFMTMLMIVFVGGSALQSLFTPETNIVIAKTDLGDIDSRSQQAAKNSTNILDVMGLNWRNPYGSSNEPLTPVDWIILNREAEKYQASASRSAVQSWLNQQDGVADLVDQIAIWDDPHALC